MSRKFPRPGHNSLPLASPHLLVVLDPDLQILHGLLLRHSLKVWAVPNLESKVVLQQSLVVAQALHEDQAYRMFLPRLARELYLIPPLPRAVGGVEHGHAVLDSRPVFHLTQPRHGLLQPLEHVGEGEAEGVGCGARGRVGRGGKGGGGSCLSSGCTWGRG